MSDTVSSDSVAHDQLRAFIERIERMEEEKKAIADDIREIYAEAKGNGFSTPVLREIIKIRKMDHAERMEKEALLDLYMAALGMQAAPREDDDYDPRGRGVTAPDSRPAALQMPRDEISSPVAVEGSRSTQGTDVGGDGDAKSAAALTEVHVGKMAAGDRALSPSEAPAPPETLGHASAKPAGTQALPVDTNSADVDQGIDRQPPKLQAAGSNPAVGANSPKPAAHNDDPRCLDKVKCGEFSNFAFCMKCREVWRAAHPIVEGAPA